MAIAAAVPGFKVTIRVNDQNLEEHNPVLSTEVNLPQNECLKYVKSTAGASFSIQYRIEDDYPFQGQGLKFHHYIDGTLAMSKPWSWRGSRIKHGKFWTARNVKEYRDGEAFEIVQVHGDIQRY